MRIADSLSAYDQLIHEFLHLPLLCEKKSPQKRIQSRPTHRISLARAEVTATESDGSTGGSTVAGAATSSVGGAAAGGAGGAIFGSAGQGAAAGAVGGAVGGLTQALLQGLFRPKLPQPSHQQFVNNCLCQKGYEPIAWK
jgi:hypothetical protein